MNEKDRRLLREEARVALHPVQLWLAERMGLTVRRAMDQLQAAAAAAQDLGATTMDADDAAARERLETLLTALLPISETINDLRALAAFGKQLLGDLSRVASEGDPPKAE